MNAGAVLSYLRGVDEVTGSQIMASTGLSRPTVHAVCDHLIALGWVRELDGRPPTRGRPGRPARCYQFNSTAGYVVGIDLGAGKVRAILVDLRGAEIGETMSTFSSDYALPDERLTLTRAAVEEVLHTNDVGPTSVLGLAVGLPAPVGADGRVDVSGEYLPGLPSVDIAHELAMGYAWPVVLENDANLAALAERWRGGGVGVDNLAVILAGERLGSGLIADGRLIRGYAGSAGELGFLDLVDGVGNTYGIGKLARKWATALKGVDPTVPNGIDEGRWQVRVETPDEAADAAEVFYAANAGDPVALAIQDRIADRIARVVGIIATFFNPETIVIGGAVAHASAALITGINDHATAYTRRPPRIIPSTLGERGVVYGAARLALDEAEIKVLNSIRWTNPSQNDESQNG